jgi:outer membrane biosynthesis protein TonB
MSNNTSPDNLNSEYLRSNTNYFRLIGNNSEYARLIGIYNVIKSKTKDLISHYQDNELKKLNTLVSNLSNKISKKNTDKVNKIKTLQNIFAQIDDIEKYINIFNDINEIDITDLSETNIQDIYTKKFNLNPYATQPPSEYLTNNGKKLVDPLYEQIYKYNSIINKIILNRMKYFGKFDKLTLGGKRKKTTRKRKTSTKKKVASKKKTVTRKRKTSTKKKVASKKKTVTIKRKTSTKKKVASKKKTLTRKRKTSTKKKVASKKKTVTRKRKSNTKRKTITRIKQRGGNNDYEQYINKNIYELNENNIIVKNLGTDGGYVGQLVCSPVKISDTYYIYTYYSVHTKPKTKNYDGYFEISASRQIYTKNNDHKTISRKLLGLDGDFYLVSDTNLRIAILDNKENKNVDLKLDENRTNITQYNNLTDYEKDILAQVIQKTLRQARNDPSYKYSMNYSYNLKNILKNKLNLSYIY